MAKIKIDDGLLERAKHAAQAEGYSSVDEFIAHCVDHQLRRQESDDAENQVADQLRGLGYIE